MSCGRFVHAKRGSLQVFKAAADDSPNVALRRVLLRPSSGHMSQNQMAYERSSWKILTAESRSDSVPEAKQLPSEAL